MTDAEELDLFGPTTSPPASTRAGRRVLLSPMARARAEEMRRQRASVEAIADALGIGKTTARVRLKAELERGLPGGQRKGRRQWQPSADDRANVTLLATEGVGVEKIAGILGITSPTLRRHCGSELARGRGLRAARAANAVCAAQDDRAGGAGVSSRHASRTPGAKET